jgi:DNA-binding transcriptional LysR family regulator
MQIHQMDLRRLRAFYLAATQGSLKSAATHLNVTVSAVSLQITALEKDFGFELLQRVGNRMQLTPEGVSLLPEIENILKAVERAIQKVSARKTTERVLLAISPNFVSQFSECLASFIRHNPGVEVVVQVKSTREILRLVTSGEADFGLDYFHEAPAGLVRTILARSGYLLLVPPDVYSGLDKRIDFARLARHSFIVFRSNSPHWRHLKETIGKQGSDIVNVIEAGNCVTACRLAEAGLGIAFAHRTCVHAYRSSPLRKLDVTRYAGRDEVAIISARRSKMAPHKLALRDHLIKNQHFPLG